jgi:hypothetical protein
MSGSPVKKESKKKKFLEGSEVRINGERTMGRQRREQWTAIDEDGVILSNLLTPRYSYNTAKGGVKHQSINQSISQSNPFTYMYINNKKQNKKN